MKIKNLITIAIIAPLLALSLTAKAGTCPTPEEFEKKSNTFFTDQDGDFALAERPIAFAGVVFMNTNESLDKVRYGKLSACLYFTENGATKFALLQGAATKVAAIAAHSEDWKAIRKNRYDCHSSNVEACQFNLYYLKK